MISAAADHHIFQTQHYLPLTPMSSEITGELHYLSSGLVSESSTAESLNLNALPTDTSHVVEQITSSGLTIADTITGSELLRYCLPLIGIDV